MPYIAGLPPNNMPLTPPEYVSTYTGPTGGVMHPQHQQQYQGYGGVGVRNEKNAFDSSDVYVARPYYAPGAPLMYPTQLQHPSQHNFNTAPPPGILHPSHTYNTSLPAPVSHHPQVPQEQPVVHSATTQRQQRTTTKDQPKEEKVVGGVAAYLDYSMDEMCEFVSHMAHGIVQSNGTISPAFRKFVSQILSSTRLPASTILLGLYYLNARMTQLNTRGEFKSGSGQVYRMLTIALLLASKFLDDNTFQNRSWAEVTGLPVAELNVLEVEWLVGIKWNLHVAPEEPKGFNTWKTTWDSWREQNAAKLAAASQKSALAPIDTNVQRHRPQQPMSLPMYQPHFPPIQQSVNVEQQHNMRSAHSAAPRYDQSWMFTPALTPQRSPPSAPETGPTTPEYYNQWGYYGQPAPFSMRPATTQSSNTVHLPSQPRIYSHAPYSGYNENQYLSHAGHHGMPCNCGYCSRPNDAYMNTGFRHQSVIG